MDMMESSWRRGDKEGTGLFATFAKSFITFLVGLQLQESDG